MNTSTEPIGGSASQHASDASHYLRSAPNRFRICASCQLLHQLSSAALVYLLPLDEHRPYDGFLSLRALDGDPANASIGMQVPTGRKIDGEPHGIAVKRPLDWRDWRGRVRGRRCRWPRHCDGRVGRRARYGSGRVRPRFGGRRRHHGRHHALAHVSLFELGGARFGGRCAPRAGIGRRSGALANRPSRWVLRNPA